MKRDSLLIVPYGIEIYYIQRNGQITPMLLIVPYGIEISLLFQGNGQNAPGLLIVPYGIEMNQALILGSYKGAFNRTLWN